MAYHCLVLLGLVVGRFMLISRISELRVISSVHGGLCPRSRLLCSQLPFRLGVFSFPPTASNWTVYLYGFVAVSSWCLVFFTNPGRITRWTTQKLEGLYPYDHFTFRAGRGACTTCITPRLARSKHCNLCVGCVTRFDHHCGWVGTCVGLYNTRYFLTFLLVHFMILFHAFAVGGEILVESVARLVDGGYVMTDTNEPILRFSLKVAFLVEPQVFFVTFAYLVTAVMVGAFLIYHLSLVWRNKTTNETFKWDSLRSACIEVKRERGAETLKELFEEDRQKNGVTVIPEFGSDDFPVNIYNRGVVANFAEVLFPHRFVRVRNMKNSKQI